MLNYDIGNRILHRVTDELFDLTDEIEEQYPKLAKMLRKEAARYRDLGQLLEEYAEVATEDDALRAFQGIAFEQEFFQERTGKWRKRQFNFWDALNPDKHREFINEMNRRRLEKE